MTEVNPIWEERREICRKLVASYKDKLPPGFDLRFMGNVLSYILPNDLYQGYPRKYGLAVGDDFFDAHLTRLDKRLRREAAKYQFEQDAIDAL